MEDEGLLKRNSRYHKAGGQKSNQYDLSGLVARLKRLADSERRVRKQRDEEDAKKRRGYV